MQITPRLQQSFLSATVFAGLIAGLMWVDPRMREYMTSTFDGGRGVFTLSHRAQDVGGAVIDAVRSQSIDNGPMMLFAVAGVVLFLFMFKA